MGDANVDEVELKVPVLLQTGTPMLKVSSKQLKTRMFRIDPDLGQVLWESRRFGIREYILLSVCPTHVSCYHLVN